MTRMTGPDLRGYVQFNKYTLTHTHTHTQRDSFGDCMNVHMVITYDKSMDQSVRLPILLEIG